MGFIDYLGKGKNILNEKFGIVPKKTKIIYHDKDSWDNFCKKRGRKSSASFLPRNLEVHMPLDSQGGINLSPLIHEYFGHGLFCEHALDGKKLVEYDKKLAKLEEKLLGKKLGLFRENSNIGLFPSKEKKTKLINSKKIGEEMSKKYDYILLSGSKDKEKIEKYMSLKKESNDFFNERLSVYEGFADWIIDFLIGQMNGNIWKEREEFLSNPQKNKWANYFKAFKNYERKEGIYPLWFEIGLPKVFKNEVLQNILREETQERFNKIKFAILYGSRKPYSDLDLFVVFDNNVKIKSYVPRDPDISEIKEKDFIEKAKMLDPQFTEPLLTGKLIYGNKSNFGELVKKIKKIKPNEKIVKYLQERSKRSSEKVQIFKKLAKENPSKQKYHTSCSLLCQSFHDSYLAFADKYKKSKRPLTLEEVLKHSKKLSSTIKEIKDLKKNY